MLLITEKLLAKLPLLNQVICSYNLIPNGGNPLDIPGLVTGCYHQPVELLGLDNRFPSRWLPLTIKPHNAKFPIKKLNIKSPKNSEQMVTQRVLKYEICNERSKHDSDGGNEISFFGCKAAIQLKRKRWDRLRGFRVTVVGWDFTTGLLIVATLVPYNLPF